MGSKYIVEVRPQGTPEGWVGACREPACGFVLNERAHLIEHESYASARLYVGRIIDHAAHHGWRVDDDRNDHHPYHCADHHQCADHPDGCGWMVEEADGLVLYDIEIYG